jgi:hypothetical protein
MYPNDDPSSPPGWPPPGSPIPPPVAPGYPPPGYPQPPQAPVGYAPGGYPPGYPPTYPPAGPYQPYGPPMAMPQNTNGFAIASLIFGIIGCTPISFVLSIIFGCIALSQIKTRGERGRGMAIGGLVACGVWAVVVAVVVTVAALTDSHDSTDATTHTVSMGALSPPVG